MLTGKIRKVILLSEKDSSRETFMQQISTQELSGQINNLIGKIESGESFIITKEGSPVAEIVSLHSKKASWKRPIKRIIMPEGVSGQRCIEEEREQE